MDLKLPSRLDYQSLPDLIEKLQSAGDEKLIIDAGALRHLGTLSLQAILSTFKTRAAAGQQSALVNANDSTVDMLGLFGFSPETLTQPESWT